MMRDEVPLYRSHFMAEIQNIAKNPNDPILVPNTHKMILCICIEGIARDAIDLAAIRTSTITMTDPYKIILFVQSRRKKNVSYLASKRKFEEKKTCEKSISSANYTFNTYIKTLPQFYIDKMN